MRCPDNTRDPGAWRHLCMCGIATVYAAAPRDLVLPQHHSCAILNGEFDDLTIRYSAWWHADLAGQHEGGDAGEPDTD